MRYFITLTQVFVLSLFLSACGGSDSGDTEIDSTEVIVSSNPTYTYDRNGYDGDTVIETININSSGSIDLKDYLFPPQSTQLNYRFIKKIPIVQVEYEEDVSEDITFNNDIVTLTRFIKVTTYAIQDDRIRIIRSDTDTFEVERNSALGRYYNVGDLVYSATESHPESSYSSNGVDVSSSSFDSNESCRISNSLSSFTKRDFSYTGDIIELACNLTGSRTVTNSLTGTEVQFINEYRYTYYKKGVGEIATIEDKCLPQNPFLDSYGTISPGCTVNAYTYTFLLE